MRYLIIKPCWHCRLRLKVPSWVKHYAKCLLEHSHTAISDRSSKVHSVKVWIWYHWLSVPGNSGIVHCGIGGFNITHIYIMYEVLTADLEGIADSCPTCQALFTDISNITCQELSQLLDCLNDYNTNCATADHHTQFMWVEIKQFNTKT